MALLQQIDFCRPDSWQSFRLCGRAMRRIIHVASTRREQLVDITDQG